MKITLNGVEKPIIAEAIEPVLVYDTDYYEEEAQEIWDAFLSGRPVYAVMYPNDDSTVMYIPLNSAICGSSSSSDSGSGSGSSSSEDTTRTAIMYFYVANEGFIREVTLHIVPENGASDV